MTLFCPAWYVARCPHRALLHKAVLLMNDCGYKHMVSGATCGPMARIIKRHCAAIEIPESIGSYEDLLDPGIVD